MTKEEAFRLLLESNAQRKAPRHDHCWHPFQGPINMVLPDGHVLMKCCHCESTETRHAAHVVGAW